MSKATTAERAKNRKPGTFSRLIKTLFSFYPVLLPLVTLGVIACAVINAIGPTFLQRALEIISTSWQSGDWEAARPQILNLVVTLGCIYAVGVLSALFWNRAMAVVTQGSLEKLREKMFNCMQDLPIRYFDTHQRGDIMSHYTNDIDTLRQMISQSLPNLLMTSIIIVTVLFIMLYYSVWMCLVIIAGVAFMALMTKLLGSNSARFFIAQQTELGVVEGHIEEVMNGQKVVKAFCHESAAEADFDERNEKLFEVSQKANMYAGQISQQINAVVMGLAGADRIFELIDEEPEADEGYVTLVNAERDRATGQLVETDKHTGLWAWKYPHHDGTITYEELRGDVRMDHVDFGYTPNREVLHDVSVFAKPGQKVAFVGATGAGKTTITNLINRFYDIADGKISYDGININKIRKADLRRSLGVVLQDVNLFTGSVMDNIRYGNLDASDAECIAAAKLAGAHDFITRLPKGYNTMLSGNGAQLSQGQRQLISIARAAVADPPAMILDEATSSIDTRTEAIVQRGMDALMNGRTTFVIAHRLSTVRNSDVIICLEHGRVIERGNHDELIAKRGYYYQLYTGAFELE